MALEKYKEKRNFGVTSEPAGKVGKKGAKPIFVVQEHHASRLHWDFRLEAEGVLKSWAVTREPTLDPSIKRLAVQVEDHPIEYAKFHGDIPKGQYGAGHVEIWDKGTFDAARGSDVADGVERGKVEVELHGRKLKGEFTLVRMGGRSGGKRGENWLLIKRRDRFAKGGSQESEDRSQKAEVKRSPDRPAAAKAGNRRASAGRVGKVARKGEPPEEIAYSSVEKVMFPEAGMTKGDVLAFYEGISSWLLPHLKDRPVTAERVPDGVGSEKAPHFWQKNTPSYYPGWIPRVLLPSEAGKDVQYALVNDEPTLMYFVNQGTVTFHVYFSRVGSLEPPDFVLFDLDPGEAEFGDVITIAQELRKVLDGEGVEAFVKTSGKTGLHVMTKWEQDGGYDEARQWAMGIARGVEENMGDIATVERSKAGRKGRVYVDVMQNALGHHAVPPYVLRATAGATVSTPLEWREVKKGLSPKKFTAAEVLKRVKRKGDLWEGLRET